MSKSENILAFEAALQGSKELQEKFVAAQKRIFENKEAEGHAEVVVKAAAEVGFTLTVAEVERTIAEAQELSEEELGNVAGGATSSWCASDYNFIMSFGSSSKNQPGKMNNCPPNYAVSL